MKEIEPFYEYRNIQLNILLALDSFCRENRINYSLAYGSLIGVVRHKGFIPWDDDIDLYMLRPEYNKLINLLPEILDGKYKLACLEKDNKWNRAYSKFYDIRTIIKEQVNNNTGIGVGIDIFPLDEIPGDINEYQPFLKKMGFLKSFYTIKSLKLSKKRSFLNNSIIVLSKLLTWPFSFRNIAEYISAKAQRYNGKKTGFFSDNSEGYASTKPFLASDFDEYIHMPFEDHEFMVMKGWYDVLSKSFGNYMELPPIEERIAHHSFVAYWK